jgi:hypothetical protein
MLQVWNDNAPLPDSLIGSAKLHLDAPVLLPLGAQGKAYELELTMPDKPTAKRGKLRLTAVASLAPEPAAPAAPVTSAQKAAETKAAPGKVEAPQLSGDAKPPAETSEPKPTVVAKPEAPIKVEAPVAQGEAIGTNKGEAAKPTEDKGAGHKDAAQPPATASGTYTCQDAVD